MIEHTFKEIQEINSDGFLQNQIAQLHARYILFNTNEEKENFPNYNIKEDNLTLLAFQYLNLGCRLAENDLLEDAVSTLERGAEVLEMVYGSSNNDIRNREYYVLISSLAYYCGFQYSKSFILIQRVEGNTLIHKLISKFLKRDFYQLQGMINQILIENDKPFQEGEEYEKFTPIRIYEKVIAKSLGKIISYLNYGNTITLEQAKEDLRILKDIAKGREEPEIWWVLRLLLIIIEGVEKASLWSVLCRYYGELPILAQKYVYSHVFSGSTRIHEFFLTQRKVMNQVINNEKGLVVSMPTSSGKTRVAEVGILDCKIRYPESKILYIAPYRSLAFEIEHNLEKVFAPAGINVSQLYGGNLFSSIDETKVQETDVIIATQEKAKALLRSNSNILESLQLIILDEGHLLGDNDRYIRSELLIEELKFSLERNKGRFILLSAVLPNPEELSEWLTLSKENVFKDDWRPSGERLGVLEWTGSQVHLKWKSADNERDSFNKNFIVSREQPRKPRQLRARFYPSSKNEAIILTAHKLLSFGPVLIFVGQKRSCFTLAELYFQFLGDSKDFIWKNKKNWDAFELSCREFDGDNSQWLKYARKGIICHNADLPEIPRLALERLIGSEKPLIIIATSTLGQGVNLGVSTVIFSTIYQSGNPIEHRDFWNIAGRAGRAFVDHEGKILIAHDTTKDKWQIKKDHGLIEGYLKKSNINRVESGLLATIKKLKHLTNQVEGLEFEDLLQIISENSFETIPDSLRGDFIKRLDLIDDTLLSLHKNFSESEFMDVSWVEEYFRFSLAYLQATKLGAGIDPTEFIEIIKNRIKGIVKVVGGETSDWVKHINSGLPLQSDLEIEENFEEILFLISAFENSGERDIDAKIKLLTQIELLISYIPVLYEDYLHHENLDTIRRLWLHGDSVAEIRDNTGKKIIKEYFSFKLPWVLNGLSRKLNDRGYISEFEVLQELSLLVEFGLPNMASVKIFQTGLRSRSACREIARLFFFNDNSDERISDIRSWLYSRKDFIKLTVSITTGEWLDIFVGDLRRPKIINYIKPFTIPDSEHLKGPLIPKRINNEGFLVSLNFEVVFQVEKINDRNFHEVYDVDGIYFLKDLRNQEWVMENRNPNIEINGSSDVAPFD